MNTRFLRIFLRWSAVTAALAALLTLSACGFRGESVDILGTAWAEKWMSPGLAREEATNDALRDAYKQMLAIAREAPGDGGRTLGEMMEDSAYVEARVRGAIQRSQIRKVTFRDDGYAEALVALRIEDIREAALAAQAELR